MIFLKGLMVCKFDANYIHVSKYDLVQLRKNVQFIYTLLMEYFIMINLTLPSKYYPLKNNLQPQIIWSIFFCSSNRPGNKRPVTVIDRPLLVF